MVEGNTVVAAVAVHNMVAVAGSMVAGVAAVPDTVQVGDGTVQVGDGTVVVVRTVVSEGFEVVVVGALYRSEVETVVVEPAVVGGLMP